MLTRNTTGLRFSVLSFLATLPGGGGAVADTLTLAPPNDTVYVRADQNITYDEVNGTGQIVAEMLPWSSGYESDILIGTIGSGVTIRTGTAITSGSGGIDLYFTHNYGTLSAQTPEMPFRILGDNWTNHGLIRISDGGRMFLGGTFTPAQMGNVLNTGGQLIVRGTVQNVGTTFALDAATTGSVEFDSSAGAYPTINGGTVTSTGGAEVIVKAGYNLYVNNVTLNAPTVVRASGSLLPTDGLVVNDTLSLQGAQNSGASVTWILSYQAQTISGNGEIVFDRSSATATKNFISHAAGGALTLGPDITVRTGTGDGVFSVGFGGSIVNQGLVSAGTSGRTITVGGGFQNDGTVESLNNGTVAFTEPYVNNGLIRATAGGVLRLAANGTNNGSLLVQDATINLAVFPPTTGTVSVTNSNVNVAMPVTPAQFHTLPLATNSPGVIAGGTLDATGTTFTADASTGSLRLFGGTLKGGRFDAAPGFSYLATGGSSALNGVTFAAPLSITEPANVNVPATGIVFDGADVALVDGNLTTTNARLTLQSAQTLAGTASIHFEGVGSGGTLRTFAGGTTTFAPGISIETGAASGNVGPGGTVGAVVNQGRIAAVTVERSITFTGASVTNTGTLEAANGGSLVFSNVAAVSNAGALRVARGSTLALTNSVFNNVAGGALTGGGTIVGNVTSAGVVAPGEPFGVLNVDGTYTQQSTGSLRVEIGGTSGSGRYDTLAVNAVPLLSSTGAATLAGTLEVASADNYTPAPDEGYAVMTYASRTGRFDQLVTTGFPTGQSFSLHYGDEELMLLPGEYASPADIGGEFDVPGTLLISGDWHWSGLIVKRGPGTLDLELTGDFTTAPDAALAIAAGTFRLQGDGVLELSGLEFGDLGDLTGDAGLAGTLGFYYAGVSAVPEPATTGSLAALGLTALALRRSRRHERATSRAR